MLPEAEPTDVERARQKLSTLVEGDVTASATFHARVFAWAQARALEHETRARSGAFVLGLSAPQGAGKSTMAATLAQLFTAHGKRAIAISIDDFYLTRREQVDLAAAHANHPYLAQRGYPGTHDVPLGTRTLAALRHLGSVDELAIPRYDKSANAGLGDRAAHEAWTRITGPVAVVIVEGWMLGFAPPSANAGEPAADEDPWLADIDERLRDYAAWTRELDAFIQLRACEDAQFVAWRVEAEERRKALGLSGMCREDIERYARSFFPAYRRYVPSLVAHPPPVPTLQIDIGANRLPT